MKILLLLMILTLGISSMAVYATGEDCGAVNDDVREAAVDPNPPASDDSADDAGTAVGDR